MLRRANWIKAILLFIVGVLLLTIVLIGWHKVRTWALQPQALMLHALARLASPNSSLSLAPQPCEAIFPRLSLRPRHPLPKIALPGESGGAGCECVGPGVSVCSHAHAHLPSALIPHTPVASACLPYPFPPPTQLPQWGGNHSPAAPEAAALSSAALDVTASVAAASTAARTVASTAAAAALHASAAASPDPPLLPAPAVAAPPGPRRLSEFDFSSENKPVGAGVIVIFVFGLLTLAGVFLASALRPVQRCAVSCGAVAVLGIVLAVLLLYPRDDGTEPTARRTDTSSLMRALIAVLLLLAALGGPITILATHLAPAQAIRLPTDLAAFKEAEAA